MTAEEIRQLVELIVSAVPAIIAVCTTVGLVIKTLREFAGLKKEVVDMKCIDDLKVDMKRVINENYELKKTLNETMTKIDHIDRSKE